MTTHDHKLVKTARTMTAGVTQSGIKQYDPIVLHDAHLIKVIATDETETIATYENGAQRVFSTFDLASFLELGAFPIGAAFHRRTENGIESLFIEHVNSDTYVVEKVVLGKSVVETIAYADLMAWHDGGEKIDPGISLVPGTHLYVPQTTVPIAVKAAAPVVAAKPVDEDTEESSEAADADTNPFETDLQKRIEQLEAEIAALEAQSQKRVNDLTVKNFELKQAIQHQVEIHATVITGYEEDIKRLEAKAAILNPAPTRKEVCTLIQVLHIPEMRKSGDVELAAKLSDGWTVLHIDISTEFTVDSDCHVRIVTLVRDLPAAPAPKVVEKTTEADLHIGAIPLTPRPPVRQPPMPANQTIIQPVSRALTHNGSKPGDTKRIPSLAAIQARRDRDNAEIDAIMQRGLDAQEALRRQFTQTPSPFPTIGAR